MKRTLTTAVALTAATLTLTTTGAAAAAPQTVPPGHITFEHFLDQQDPGFEAQLTTRGNFETAVATLLVDRNGDASLAYPDTSYVIKNGRLYRKNTGEDDYTFITRSHPRLLTAMVVAPQIGTFAPDGSDLNTILGEHASDDGMFFLSYREGEDYTACTLERPTFGLWCDIATAGGDFTLHVRTTTSLVPGMFPGDPTETRFSPTGHNPRINKNLNASPRKFVRAATRLFPSKSDARAVFGTAIDTVTMKPQNHTSNILQQTSIDRIYAVPGGETATVTVAAINANLNGHTGFEGLLQVRADMNHDTFTYRDGIGRYFSHTSRNTEYRAVVFAPYRGHVVFVHADTETRALQLLHATID